MPRRPALRGRAAVCAVIGRRLVEVGAFAAFLALRARLRVAERGAGVALVDRLGAGTRAGSRGGIILTTVDALVDWSRGQSLWAMPMGTACCAMELIAASFSKFDFDRLGTFPRPDPRHTDVMVVAGTITEKMEPAVKRLYDQMPDPKWVIAMGNCTVSGGIFYYDTYSVVRGADSSCRWTSTSRAARRARVAPGRASSSSASWCSDGVARA